MKLKNNRGESTYISTSIAILITVVIGALVIALWSWIAANPVAEGMKGAGNLQHAKEGEMQTVVFETTTTTF